MIMAIAVSFFIFLYLIPIVYWMMARFSDIKISLFKLTLMRLKGISVKRIVNSLILAKKGEINIDIEILESHSKAGGNTINVIMGMIAAKTAHVNLNIRDACADDLNGINIYERIKEIASTRG